MGDATCLVVAVLSPVNKFIEFCHEATLLQAQIISFPDLLWTKPKARSGKVIKFVFLNWLLHLTPVQSRLWKLTRFSAANFLQTQVLNLEISAVGENEKPIRKDERRKDLEVICHSGLSNFCNMIVPLPKSQTRHPARTQAPSISHTCFSNPSPCSQFFLRLRGRPISARKQHVGS